MYKYLFGPVPSRRLGMSLGIDLVPHKVCSLDCVYCECGATTKLTTDRMEYVPVEKVKSELTDYFKSNPDPDYITFSGSGEPTLNSKFGEIVRFIKETQPQVNIAVLSNGTLFSDSKLRSELLLADLVVPSLDAATEEAFAKINRPEKDINLTDYVNGLIDFSSEFEGAIWLELFFLKGYNNDDKNINAISEIVKKINPDKVQLNTLDRPGTVDDLEPMSKSDLELIADMIDFSPVEIVASFKKTKVNLEYRNDIENLVIETIRRRPCTIDDLIEITSYKQNEIHDFLIAAEIEGKVYTSTNTRGTFYHLKDQ